MIKIVHWRLGGELSFESLGGVSSTPGAIRGVGGGNVDSNDIGQVLPARYCVRNGILVPMTELLRHLAGMARMAKRLDHILVIDIESTCWEGGFPPRGEANDIIEIGLTPLEVSSGRRIEKRSILVRPERSKVSPFCTELTTLNQGQVEGGVAFKDACRILEDEYHSRDRLWASFGDYDRRSLEAVSRTGHPLPVRSSHLNVKTLFAVAGAVRRVGLPQAMGSLGLRLGNSSSWPRRRVECRAVTSRLRN